MCVCLFVRCNLALGSGGLPCQKLYQESVDVFVLSEKSDAVDSIENLRLAVLLLISWSGGGGQTVK